MATAWIWALGGDEVVGLFLGTHTPRLDDKGRLALPARFRTELEGGVVISKGQDHCLFLFPSADFATWAEELGQAPTTDKRARDFARILFASASHEVPDAQGRIAVSPLLREYADLTKDCVVTGAFNRLEIWNPDTWQAYLASRESDFADVAEQVLPGTF